jgi:hypothetical protein
LVAVLVEQIIIPLHDTQVQVDQAAVLLGLEILVLQHKVTQVAQLVSVMLVVLAQRVHLLIVMVAVVAVALGVLVLMQEVAQPQLVEQELIHILLGHQQLVLV